MASFYMDGPALSWYQWMYRNGFITSWNGLLQALETRFAPSYYDDPRGALFKLNQRGSVNDYLTDFERLANRIVGLQPQFLLSCFISGLSPEIRREVIALQPISLPQAAALAKLQEDKLNDRRRSFRPGPPTPSHPPPPPALGPPSSTHPKTPTAKPIFTHCTPEEMAFRREKGLCYNCDEKWSSSHRCKGRILLFIADEPDPSPPLSPSSDPTPLDPEPLSSPLYLISVSTPSLVSRPQRLFVYLASLMAHG